ncbi:nucleolar protein of 40 kda [Plakobranchus ocellatus]|uniref:Nucleolar protein of 40 kDa n=1 Tax=Plakobranchus ocellatus TaxID=259542 RepID=A0AAV3Y6C4_9GAST|nr:nucleolar protein of 40 kda [Plakobranchus ocellatus]
MSYSDGKNNVPKLYAIFHGEVASLQAYGAFIKIPGCKKQGLVHKSQMSSVRVEDPSEMLAKGEKVYCKVIGMEVASLQAYGAFIKIPGCKKQGLVHKSQMSSVRIEDPSEMLAKGEKVYCKVIGMEGEGEKISLSMKVVNQTTGKDLDPNNVQLEQDSKKRRQWQHIGKDKIELGAELNTTCRKCGGHGHLTMDCFAGKDGTQYDLIPDIETLTALPPISKHSSSAHKQKKKKKEKKKKKKSKKRKRSTSSSASSSSGNESSGDCGNKKRGKSHAHRQQGREDDRARKHSVTSDERDRSVSSLTKYKQIDKRANRDGSSDSDRLDNASSPNYRQRRKDSDMDHRKSQQVKTIYSRRSHDKRDVDKNKRRSKHDNGHDDDDSDTSANTSDESLSPRHRSRRSGRGENQSRPANQDSHHQSHQRHLSRHDSDVEEHNRSRDREKSSAGGEERLRGQSKGQKGDAGSRLYSGRLSYEENRRENVGRSEGSFDKSEYLDREENYDGGKRKNESRDRGKEKKRKKHRDRSRSRS